jgi:serine/threonine protein kinase
MGKHISFGEPQNDSEVWAFKYLEKHLPDEIEFLTNIEVLSESGQPFEVDAIVLAPWAIHLIDVKGYHGSIRVGKDIWELDGRQVENPLPKANLVAKLFKSRLQRRSSKDMHIPWCQGGAFITGVQGQGLSLVKTDPLLCAWGPNQIVEALTSKQCVTSSFKHEVTSRQWRLARDVAGQTDLVLRKQNRIGDFVRTMKIHADRGMEVWLANYEHGDYKRRFLLKMLDPSGYQTSEEAKRAISSLRTEASLYLELSGLAGIPYVAPLIDTGELLALPIRLPAGRSLSQLDVDELDEEQRLIILRAAATALLGIHSRGLSHGNLKPDSIFVGDGGEVEFLDIRGCSDAGKVADRSDLARAFEAFFKDVDSEIKRWFASEDHDLEALRSLITLLLNPLKGQVAVAEPIRIRSGEVIADHFRLIEEFRKEAGVSMWRARHVLGRFDCALMIHDHGIDGYGHVKAEFEMLGHIFHPNICRVFEAGSIDEERHYIARAWVPGRSLSSIIADGSAFDEQELLMCARQAATAIQYLHSTGVTHRNVKPASMIWDENSIVLVDLGMTDPDNTKSGSILFRDPRVVGAGWSEQADLYGLSLSLLCIASGVVEPPFRTSEEWQDFVANALKNLPSDLAPGVKSSMELFPDGLPDDYLDFFGLREDELPLTEIPDELRERWGISKGYMEFLVVDMLNDGRMRSRKQWVLGALRSRHISGNKTNYGSMNSTISRLFSAGVAEKYKSKVRLTLGFVEDWKLFN